MTTTWAALFPPMGLRLSDGAGLELRYLDDEVLPAVAAVAREGIHDPSWQPMTGWTDEAPELVARSTAQHAWRTRAETSPERWALSFAVLVDGRVVGRQDVMARDFGVRREVGTGSWLGRAHQGRGTGTRMRLAVLSLAFDHLLALTASTEAWKDNAPSNRVSAAVGYERDGEDVEVVRGERREGWRYRLTAERWRELGHPKVQVDGLSDACRSLLGVT